MTYSIKKVCIDKELPGKSPYGYHPSDTTTIFPIIVAKHQCWRSGSNLRICFVNGALEIQQKIQQVAFEWTDYANIKFQFVQDKGAEIRITFQENGSWSYIGTDALEIPYDEATMNFGWLTKDLPDNEFSWIVLHLFGHALGLIHEHQNPAAGIHWNKEAVYQALSGPPNNLDRRTIDNMFERYNKNITNYSQVDTKSVMILPIPAEFTLDGMSYGEGVFDLSDTDKDFIKEKYM
jgi:serralysin